MIDLMLPTVATEHREFLAAWRGVCCAEKKTGIMIITLNLIFGVNSPSIDPTCRDTQLPIAAIAPPADKGHTSMDVLNRHVNARVCTYSTL
jgi:hypothetical protein